MLSQSAQVFPDIQILTVFAVCCRSKFLHRAGAARKRLVKTTTTNTKFKSKKCERNYFSKNEMFNKNQVERGKVIEEGKSCLMFR